MGKVIGGASMSLDGFINDHNGDVSRLYPDMEELHTAEFMQESIHSTGAVVMGRHAYDMANGDFTGYEYQVPIFVLTHHAPQQVAKGETGAFKFHFVAERVEDVIARARAAAREKNVMVVGGASVFQQCLKAGLLDVIEIGIMPVLLGKGLRLFDEMSVASVDLEKIKVVETKMRTELLFRVIKRH